MRIVESTAILWYGGLPFLWNYSTDLATRFGFTEDFEVLQLGLDSD
jgi:hypothetical protein